MASQVVSNPSSLRAPPPRDHHYQNFVASDAIFRPGTIYRQPPKDRRYGCQREVPTILLCGVPRRRRLRVFLRSYDERHAAKEGNQVNDIDIIVPMTGTPGTQPWPKKTSNMGETRSRDEVNTSLTYVFERVRWIHG